MKEQKDKENVSGCDLLEITDYTPELLDKVEKELKERLMATWKWVHQATQEITGDHAILFDYPIKSPSLEVYDNLGDLMAELRKILLANKK